MKINVLEKHNKIGLKHAFIVFMLLLVPVILSEIIDHISIERLTVKLNLLISILLSLSFFLPIIYMLRTTGHIRKDIFKINSFSLIPLLSALFLASGLWTIAANISEPELKSFWQYKNFDFNVINLFISGIIFAPVYEEVIFRAYMLFAFEKKFRDIFVIIISSVLFMLYHYPYLEGFPVYLATGIVTAWVTLKTQSIFPAIICHMYRNFMLIFDIPLIYIPFEFSKPIYHALAVNSLALISIISGIYIMYLYEKGKADYA